MKIFNTLLLLFLPLLSNISFSAEINACSTEECQKYFKKYKKYARTGYADAMSALGEFYYHGYGIDKNINKALVMFRRATKYGSYTAPIRVALLRLTEPSLRDIDEAITYLKKAARLNHPAANFLLGTIYASESYGKYDSKKADHYLTKAYKSTPKIMNRFIDYLSSKKTLSPQKFPLLTATLAKNIHQKNSNSVYQSKNSKEINDSSEKAIPSKSEIITVHGPSLTSIFNQQFEFFDKSTPEKTSTVGTKIAGRSCKEILSCSSVDLNDFKNMIDAAMMNVTN